MSTHTHTHTHTQTHTHTHTNPHTLTLTFILTHIHTLPHLHTPTQDALFCLADLHYHGTDGIVKDEAGAYEHYVRAAEAGHADAMCCLGTMHYLGQGGRAVNREVWTDWVWAVWMGVLICVSLCHLAPR